MAVPPASPTVTVTVTSESGADATDAATRTVRGPPSSETSATTDNAASVKLKEMTVSPDSAPAGTAAAIPTRLTVSMTTRQHFMIFLQVGSIGGIISQPCFNRSRGPDAGARRRNGIGKGGGECIVRDGRSAFGKRGK